MPRKKKVKRPTANPITIRKGEDIFAALKRRKLVPRGSRLIDLLRRK